MRITTAKTDLLICVVFAVAGWILAVVYDLFEILHDYLHHYEYLQLDETLIAVLAISLAGCWFSFRRWQEALKSAQEISNIKKSLEQIQNRHEEAQHIARLGHWELDLINNDLLWSKENYAIFGDKTGNENTYETFLERVHPDDRDYVNQAYTDSLEKRTHYDIEHRLLMGDGRIKWVNERCKTFYDETGKPVRSIGTTQDITRQKKLEESNRSYIFHLENMQKITDTIQASDVSNNMPKHVIKEVRQIFNADRAWLFHPCDPAAESWEVPVEVTVPEFPGAFASKQRFPMTPEMKQVIQDALDSSEPVIYCPMPSIDGHVDQFAVRSLMMIAIRPKFGKPWIFGLHQCSHERVWTDDEKRLFQSIGLRMSDLLSSIHLNHDLITLSQAVQQAGEAVLITNQHAVIEYVNPAFTQITGYMPEEIIGKTPAILKSTAQDPSFYKELWKTITSGEVWHGTLIDRKRSGEFYPALMSIAPIHNDAGEITHYVSLQQDMTDYKRMEQQFLQAQKMESIGTLVGGIAHDFNNILAAVMGNVYLARLKKDEPDSVSDKLENIESLGYRASEMVRQLLTFARKDTINMKPFSINSFMKEGFKLAQSAIPENIEHSCDACQENLVIVGDPTQLQQVLMNLISNARDAVKGVLNPKINCSLEPYQADAKFIERHSELSGVEMARISVHDNGCGIKEEHQDKVFEPFFTTKSVGEGTGLGLAMVYGSVQAHGGVVELESKVGEGSIIHVYLPVKEKELNPELEDKVELLHGDRELILLVDDEADVRTTTRELLKAMEYQVLEASDGEEALELYHSNRDKIRLVISDVIMPKMGGVELMKTIHQLDKERPVVLITGYDMEQIMDLDEVEVTHIMNKPFSILELSQLIQALLKDG